MSFCNKARGHGLTNQLAELLALIRVLDGVIERSLCNTEHLRSNTNTSLIQNLDGDLSSADRPCVSWSPAHLVSFADLADDVRRGNSYVVKGQDAGGRRPDTELYSQPDRSRMRGHRGNTPWPPSSQSQRPYPCSG